MPVHLPPTGVHDPEEWLLRYFVHALEQTWNAWCNIAIGMRESGCYVVSPLLLPTRVLWLNAHDPGVDFGSALAEFRGQAGNRVMLDRYSNYLNA